MKRKMDSCTSTCSCGRLEERVVTCKNQLHIQQTFCWRNCQQRSSFSCIHTIDLPTRAIPPKMKDKDKESGFFKKKKNCSSKTDRSCRSVVNPGWTSVMVGDAVLDTEADGSNCVVNISLRSEVKQLKDKARRLSIRKDSFMCNDKVQCYTGLPSSQIIEEIFN